MTGSFEHFRKCQKVVLWPPEIFLATSEKIHGEVSENLIIYKVPFSDEENTIFCFFL